MCESEKKRNQVQADRLDLVGFLHEWNSRAARAFLARAGISPRNWRMTMRKHGFADGRVWTYENLADDALLSRPRCHQIVKRTQELLARYFGLSPAELDRLLCPRAARKPSVDRECATLSTTWRK